MHGGTTLVTHVVHGINVVSGSAPAEREDSISVGAASGLVGAVDASASGEGVVLD